MSMPRSGGLTPHGVTSFLSICWSIKSDVIGYAEQDNVATVNEETQTPGYWLVNVGATWSPFSAIRVEARSGQSAQV